MGEHDHSDMDGHGAGHGSFAWVTFESVVVLALLGAAIGYALALWASRGRRTWPVSRTVMWYLGLGCVGAALVGPLATAAHTSFTAHMVGHLLLGMVGPLLLVLAAPVTVALRALPVPAARSLTRFLRTPVMRVLTHPVVAASLNIGGLWVLYTTDLYLRMHSSTLIYALVHTHIFLAGYLFTVSIVGVDPAPHRASMRMRSAVLIVFVAVHSILAKRLYAHPPAGTTTADGEVGAQVMYYGGDVVDVIMIVLLFAGHYAATRPRAAALAGRH